MNSMDGSYIIIKNMEVDIMDIEFTKFETNEHWVAGMVDGGEFYFEAKLFDEGSIHGIESGRVSKLSVSVGNRWKGFENCIVNYDRGWDIEPNEEDIEVYEEILEFLENSPKTRF